MINDFPLSHLSSAGEGTLALVGVRMPSIRTMDSVLKVHPLVPGHAGQRAAVQCRTWAGFQHSGSPVACATGHRFRGLERCSSQLLQAQWGLQKLLQKQGLTAGWSDEARVLLERASWLRRMVC